MQSSQKAKVHPTESFCVSFEDQNRHVSNGTMAASAKRHGTTSKKPRSRPRKKKGQKSLNGPFYPTFLDAVALDCEMVGVGPGGACSVLARVSIVGLDGRVLLDSFVKVLEPVTDYRTAVSGIRPQDLMDGSAVDFGIVRKRVLHLISNKILVGHGLLNDLRIMNVQHPWTLIRDSATYSPFLRMNGHPRRLRELVLYYLGRRMQRDGEEHDSIEDARAAMQLYVLHRTSWDLSASYQLQT